MVTSETYFFRRVTVALFIYKDLLSAVLQKYNQVFLLLVIVTESIKSNMSVNFVEVIP